MTDILETVLYEGVSVTFKFDHDRPTFGDLLSMVGTPDARFPVSKEHDWSQLVGLGFQQADDYFAIPSTGESDFSIWLYPLVNDRVVDHYAGPLDAVRLEYCILRNPPSTLELFRTVILDVADVTGSSPLYVERNLDLGNPPGLERLISDVEAVVAHWKSNGIEVGSDAALQIDF